VSLLNVIVVVTF